MNFLQDSILLMAALNTVFALIVYLHSKKSAQELFFIFSAFFVGVWALAIFILVSPGIELSLFKFSLIGHFWAGNFIFLSFLWFAWFYRNPTPKQYIILPLLASVGDIILLLSMAFSDFVFKSIKLAENLNEAVDINKIGYASYSVYLLSIFLIIEFILVKKYVASSGKEKKQLGDIIIGTFVAGLLGMTTNLFLPNFGIFSFFAFGPALSSIFVAGISYAILKHALFNLRIIATELFAIILMMSAAGNIFTAENKSDVLVGGFIFILVLVFGILLIRSVYREVRQREEIERLAADLAVANEELKKLDQAKSEFLSIASHQLRTPLTAIKGYASMLLEGGFGKLSVKALEVITKMAISTENLIRLISDLLNLSRIESGKIQYEMASNDVVKILSDAVDGLKVKAEKLELNLQFENTAGTEFSAMCDKDKIREVFINLVDNAVKYTKRNGKVLISINRIRDQIRISVKDDGLGISVENMHKLFVKFARAEDAARFDPNGLGLGLYFAKRVVEDHGGKIWVESEGTGKGSTFFVELPIQQKN